MLLSKKPTDRGTFMLFFAAGILPLLMFMMALSLDITNYMRADQRLQESADDAAMLAWRYLPYKQKAIEAVNRFIAQRGLGGAIAEIRMAPSRSGAQDYSDEFEVILEQQLPLTFMSYLASDTSLPIRSVARTRSTPLDVYIAVDRSAYVAPAIPSDPWVNPVISDYFRNTAPFQPFVDPFDGANINVAPAAFMTQLCYNPYFTEIKKTALTLYEYFAAVGRNGIGIGVFPGISIDYLRNIRAVLRPSQDANPNALGSGEAWPLQTAALRNQQDYFIYNGVQLGASSWCAAAAAQDNSIVSFEPFGSGQNATIDKIWRAPVEASKNKNEITQPNGGDVVFNPDYQSALSVREAVWSAIAKPSTPNSRGVFDAVIANLASGPDFEVAAGKAVRGGLTGTSTRTAIILAGDVPYFNGIRFDNGLDAVAAQISQSFSVLRQLLVDNENLRFKMLYVIMDEDLRPSSTALVGMEDKAARLADFFEYEKNITNLDGRIDLQVIYSRNFRQLNEQVLAAAILDNNRKVLSY